VIHSLRREEISLDGQSSTLWARVQRVKFNYWLSAPVDDALERVGSGQGQRPWSLFSYKNGVFNHILTITAKSARILGFNKRISKEFNDSYSLKTRIRL
jgi:hypothetical protein